jgi:hypothetical protein
MKMNANCVIVYYLQKKRNTRLNCVASMNISSQSNLYLMIIYFPVIINFFSHIQGVGKTGHVQFVGKIY